MNAEALNAANADNLIGAGEEQRHYQRKTQQASEGAMSSDQTLYVNRLNDLLRGDIGVFKLRRQILDLTLDAQNALFPIRPDASQIFGLAIDFANGAKAVLTVDRSSLSRTIQFTRACFATISLLPWRRPSMCHGMWRTPDLRGR